MRRTGAILSLVATTALTAFAGCSDAPTDSLSPARVGPAATIVGNTGPQFYVWADSSALNNSGLLQHDSPLGFRIQGTPGYAGYSEFNDRQEVQANNCDKSPHIDAAFVQAHAGEGMLYIIGDEPDHNPVAFGACGNPAQVPLYSPAEYASVFHTAVTLIRGYDSTARFSNGGFTVPGASPGAPYKHFTDYADDFIAAYNSAFGEDPPVDEWRFNVNGLTAPQFGAVLDPLMQWRAGRNIFIGSMDGDNMAYRVGAVLARPIVGAAWWSLDDGASSLMNTNGTINQLGQDYRRLIAPIPDGTYKIVNRNSGKVLDVAGAQLIDGANVHQYTYQGTDNEKWNFALQSDGSYRIEAVHSGKVLTVANAGTGDGENVWQWTDLGTANQRWLVTREGPYMKLTAVHSGKALAVQNGSMLDQANVQQWSYGGYPNEEWTVETP
jgi:hypothetical protein